MASIPLHPDQDLAAAIELRLQSGQADRDIADALGVALSTVRVYRRHVLGLALRATPAPSVDEAYFRELHEWGWPVDAIATHLGLTRRTVQQLHSQWGLRARYRPGGGR